MFNVGKSSIFIPSAQEVDRAAKVAMENISKQLKKMPPMKKAASALDNFPWIYNNLADYKPHVLGQTVTPKAVLKEMVSEFAINSYKNVG